MKTIYTQELFDALPVVDGVRHCPTGDYTQVREIGPDCKFGPHCTFGPYCTFDSCCTFGPYCTFGPHCTFGHSCAFGSACTFENTLKVQHGYPFLTFGGGGSENRTVYFYNTPEVHVRAGCFLGTLEEFRAKVLADDVHHTTAPSVKTRQYLGMAEIASLTFIK